MVFRGALGPWYDTRSREYHVDRKAACDLATQVIDAYRGGHKGSPPSQVVLHGRVAFDAEEWTGFCEAIPRETDAVGVVIKSGDLKVY